jgi:hypothetical protein
VALSKNLFVLLVLLLSACSTRPFDSPNSSIKKFTYYNEQDVNDVYTALFSDHKILGAVNKNDVINDKSLYSLAEKHKANIVLANMRLTSVGPSQLAGQVDVNGSFSIYETVGKSNWSNQYLFLQQTNNKKYFWEKELPKNKPLISKSEWVQCATVKCERTFGFIDVFTFETTQYMVVQGNKIPFARFELNSGIGVLMDLLDGKTPYLAMFEKQSLGFKLKSKESNRLFIPLQFYKKISKDISKPNVSLY